MEQTKKKRPFTVWHALGLLLILATALSVWFGVHPRYRVLSYGILALGVLAAWKRNWMLWIVIAVELGFVIFLWTFPQDGYKIVSIIPLLLIAMLLVFCFGKKPIKILAAIVLIFGIGVSMAAQIPIIRAALELPERNADYIIVLGAAVYGEEPSITLQHRIQGAYRYLTENPDTKAVVSGGQGEGEDISEAECMRRELIADGIESDRILLENRSTSTMENLAFSKAVIEADGGSLDHIVIVSSGYHLYRAKQMAKSLGMQTTGKAGADGYPIYMYGMNLREVLAVWKLWVFGA